MCFTAYVFNLSSKCRVRNEGYIIFWCIILFLLYAFKDNNVGSDFPTYLNYFFEIEPSDWSFLTPGIFIYPNFEKGYLFLTQLIANISQTDVFFTFVMACIMTICPIIIIQKYTKPVWMGIFLFFALSLYTNSFSMLRQNIAMYICWFSIPYVLNRSLVKFLLIIILAFFFHRTAIVFLPIYFLYNIKFSFKYYVFALGGTFILYLLLLPLMSIITDILAMNDYTDSDVSGGFILLFFIAFCYFFCAYVFKNNSEPYIHVFLQMLFLALILQLLATKFNILTRIIDYYKIALIVLLPAAIWKPIFKKDRMLVISLFLILFIYFFYRTNVANLTATIPYVFR